MSRKTSFDELYTTIGALVSSATGRLWWRKQGIQARPATPYCTIYLVQNTGLEKNIVESVELEDSSKVFEQIPWNTTLIEVQVEFYKGASNNSALQAAQRVKSALYLEERFWDLWEIASLSGGVQIIDVSTMFREDVEQRTEVRFSIWANVAEPLPLEDTGIDGIEYQKVDVIHVRQDYVETVIPIETEAIEGVPIVVGADGARVTIGGGRESRVTKVDDSSS